MVSKTIVGKSWVLRPMLADVYYMGDLVVGYNTRILAELSILCSLPSF